MQKVIFKIIPLLLILFSAGNLNAQDSPTEQLTMADSLFTKRRYTQSMELYRSIYDRGYSSPSMLLKMSFIAEGLERPEEALAYLDRYYLNTGDASVQNKIQELAKEFNLSGWETTGSDAMRLTLERYNGLIIPTISALAIFLIAFMYYQKSRLNTRPVTTGILLVIVVSALYYTAHYGRVDYGVIEDTSSPIMSAPSSGSDVVGIVRAGHRVKLIGREDVWIRIIWDGKEAYIRSNHIKKV